jgi:hypothetical protein
MEDLELIAQELSAIGERVGRLENLLSDLVSRLGDVEKVNGQLEGAALTTARALQEISGHWDSVYEAMRRTEDSDEAPEKRSLSDAIESTDRSRQGSSTT